MVKPQFALGIGLVFVLAVAISGGCGGNKTGCTVVSGTVVHKGKPVSNGRIRFVPTSAPGSVVAARIAEGRYRADVRGGLSIGTYKVEVEAYGKMPTSPNPMWKPQNCLPKRHGADSQLRITIEPGGREIVKDFTLTD